MTSLLYAIIIAAMLSVTSLTAIVLRVSPLLSPAQALPAFFASVFLSIATIATLVLWVFWHAVSVHAWDDGKILSVSLRQGLLCAAATAVLLLFHLLGILTWWIGLLIYLVFVLVEVALEY